MVHMTLRDGSCAFRSKERSKRLVSIPLKDLLLPGS